MTFSASPLVPDQATGADTEAAAWAQAAQRVIAAVTVALPQIPSATPLTLGEPAAGPDDAPLPSPAGAAVTGYLGAGIEGKVLLVVGQELVDALAGTPFGSVPAAQALKPALETIAAELGGRLDGEANGTDVDDCLDVLADPSGRSATVLLPLLAGTTVSAFVGVSLAAPETGRATAAPAARSGNSWGIDMLRDVEMEVTCELGRTKMTVRQLLALAPGDVVELDRLAGSPADLLVNGTLLARGEVVVVDEAFGLRITEIVTMDAS